MDKIEQAGDTVLELMAEQKRYEGYRLAGMEFTNSSLSRQASASLKKHIRR